MRLRTLLLLLLMAPSTWLSALAHAEEPGVPPADLVPLLTRIAGTYSSGCRKFPFNGPAQGPITIAADGRFKAPGISGNIHQANLALSRIPEPGGQIMFDFIAEIKDVLLRLQTNVGGKNQIRLSKGDDGIICDVTDNLARINSGTLYANFVTALNEDKRIECMDIDSRKETQRLDYRIKDGKLKVFDVLYDLTAFESEVVTINPKQLFNYVGFKKDGQRLMINKSMLSPFSVTSKQQDESGYSCG